MPVASHRGGISGCALAGPSARLLHAARLAGTEADRGRRHCAQTRVLVLKALQTPRLGDVLPPKRAIHCKSWHRSLRAWRTDRPSNPVICSSEKAAALHVLVLSISQNELVSSLCEAEIRANRSASTEALGIIDRCPVGERSGRLQWRRSRSGGHRPSKNAMALAGTLYWRTQRQVGHSETGCGLSYRLCGPIEIE